MLDGVAQAMLAYCLLLLAAYALLLGRAADVGCICCVRLIASSS